jgi:hypothetical protein
MTKKNYKWKLESMDVFVPESDDSESDSINDESIT